MNGTSQREREGERERETEERDMQGKNIILTAILETEETESSAASLGLK
jgi:hypothetical protein